MARIPDPRPVLGWPTANHFLLDALARHKEFVKSVLGPATTPDDYAVVDIDFDDDDPRYGLAAAVAIRLPGAKIRPGRTPSAIERALSFVRGVRVAPGSTMALAMECQSKGRQVGEVAFRSRIYEMCAAVDLDDGGDGVLRTVYLAYQRLEGPGERLASSTVALVVARRELHRFQRIAKRMMVEAEPDRSRLYTYDGGSWSSEPVAEIKWEHLVLSDEAAILVKRDVETFFEREPFFRDNGLPFRRGYLLHGPPGNGKTSMVRALLSARRMNAYAMRLFSDQADDQSVSAVFERAADNAPSILLLEDLDRAFPKGGNSRCRVSLQALLNELDGVSTRDGVVAVATANEPTALDKAILKRPGRFDRAVYFGNPEASLRETYFRRKLPSLSEADAAEAASATEGFSFAQLQEVYILAGQRAYDAGERAVTPEGLLYGAGALKAANVRLAQRSDETSLRR